MFACTDGVGEALSNPLEFKLLGGLSIRAGGRLLPLGARKQRTLTALLLAKANAVVALPEITEELWGESPPMSATANLRTYAARFRGALPPAQRGRLVVRPAGYLLRVEPGELDLNLFDDRVSAARAALQRAEDEQALLHLELALAMFRGRLAEDVQLGPLLSARAIAVDAQLSSAREDLGEVLLRLGRSHAAVDLLHGLVAAEPLRERAWALLMRALYAVDDVGGALDTFARARRALTGSLGIEPGEELRQIHQAVLRRELTSLGAGAVRGSSATRAALPHRLPPAPPIVGHVAELKCLIGYAGREGGVVGVHGPAGAGTSTVALHAAHAVAERFPDGQLYVDLRGRHRRDARPPVIARYRLLLAERRMLLVLDNATDVAQIRPYLAAAPRCTILVASCPMLATLDGTRHLRLGELDDTACSALLAQHIDPARLRADPDAVRQLAVLCGHLPLALRIAAARLAAHPDWPVRELVDRLRDDNRRLDELEACDLAVRASLRVSYDILLTGARPADRLAANLFAMLGSQAAVSQAAVSHAAVSHGTVEFRPADLARQLRTPPADVRRALDRLVEVELVRATGPRRYRLTGLTRLLAREVARAPAATG